MTDEQRQRKRENDRIYYTKHRAKILEKRKKYYWANPERAKERSSRYKAKNRAKINELSRVYRQNNREEIAENHTRRVIIGGMHLGMVGMTRKQRQKFIEGVGNGTTE